MTIIGICGSSGSGKSSVCRILSQKGIPILDCDKIYHELINAPSACLTAIGEEFGNDLIAGGSLDRRALREIVFSSKDKAEKLNRITHRFVKEELKRRILDLRNSDSEFCIIDAPMFFEANLECDCDFVCAVCSEPEDQIKRICKRDGISPDDAKKRLKHQLSNDILKEKADFIIYNGKGLDELTKQCESMLNAVHRSIANKERKTVMSEKNKLEEALCYTSKSAAKVFSADKKKLAFDFAEGYKAFLDAAKTERESVEYALTLAKEKGYVPFEYGKEYVTGDRVYYVNRNKALILANIGKKSPEEGFGIIASHVDAPRIDLKPNPLCEMESIAYFKTHYYGGIKKYQWPTTPLALHGIVVLGDGTEVSVKIGEDESDPIFYITDLLPHLAQDQMKRVAGELTPGENLKVIVGSLPVEEEDVKEAVKLNVLSYLNEKYGMVEEDFISAELMLVPAMKARDVGFDRNLIASYAHDDRVCAYPSLIAMLDAENPTYTSILVLTDKEEIGSSGNTGLNTNYLYDFLIELCGKKNARLALKNSWCLSADVNACYDPIFPEVYEKQNSSILNHGVIITKYTGARGKSGTSDASAEFMGKIRTILNKNNVVWQIGELGKVDQGGGGTVAQYVAKLNIDVVDLGVPVLSMHAPYEVVSKLDVYSTYEACLGFFNRD